MSKKILIPIIAGAVAVIGIILFLVLSSSDSYITIKIVENTGTVKVDRGEEKIDAYEGMKMRDKDRIETLSDGFSRINCDRETFAHFEHNSEAEFIADSEKKLTIDLKKGELVVEVQKALEDDDKFEVVTPNTTLAIRGTVIAIRVTPTDDGGYRTVNYILEGHAEFENTDGEHVTLEAGEGRLTVTDNNGRVVESSTAGADEFEFSNIDINSLRGAGNNPMTLRYSGENPGSSTVTDLSDPEINEVNFPDPVFRQYVADNLDTNGDGIISGEERNVKDIRVTGMKISNLKGIEYFSELEILYCNKNNLTSLDISHNSVLRLLECQENQLTELDVSNNSELVNLLCGENKLTSIDISKNLKLGELNIKKNKLTELDTSANLSLTHIRCDHNDITSLDLSKNTELRDLFCLKNKLTEIDLSNNTKLVYLDLGSNNLTELDVSKNPELKQITCYSNKLTSLDLSNNTGLYVIKCDGNELTELDVSHNTQISELSCSGNKLTALDLSNNPGLKQLTCFNNEIATLDVTNNPELNFLRYDEGTTELIE